MKTIAVSIDEATLEEVHRLAAAGGSGGRGGGRREGGKNVSALVRAALHEYLAKQARIQREETDRSAYRKKGRLVNRQAAALVAQQAKP